ncbi:MAG: UDP-glucose/GDP-mannose dehydrogenase family protein [Acidobacteriota bacterium]
MKVCVVGSGYVGLVTGACLADFGMTVTGVDKDASKIAALHRGEIPIYEPGLRSLVAKNETAGRLSFTTELGPAIEEAQAVFIAVGTPPKADGSADLTFVRQVAESVADHLNGYKIIVTKSTVPIGTGQMIEDIVHQRTAGRQAFAVVSNPEFLREGSAIEDFMRPDRVVIGSRDPRALELMREIYAPLKVADVPFVETNVESAELIKYASNGFLATKISFINEVADLCEALGADVEVVSRGMGLDNRIGPKFLSAGPGFGGSCFPKDTRAVVQIAHDAGRRFHIVEAVLEVNNATQRRMIDKVDDALDGVAGKSLALLGLSFKPDTDDIRESPALTIAAGLAERGATLRVFDPEAMEASQPILPQATFCSGPYEAADGADAVIILTEWNQFRALELEELRQRVRQPTIIDLRNIYEPARVAAAGFRYVSVGRSEARPAEQAAETAATPAVAQGGEA